MAKTLYYNAVTEEMEFVNNPSPLRENLGERFGLNEGGRIDMKPGGLVEPGVTHYGKALLDDPTYEIKKGDELGKGITQNVYAGAQKKPTIWKYEHKRGGEGKRSYDRNLDNLEKLNKNVVLKKTGAKRTFATMWEQVRKLDNWNDFLNADDTWKLTKLKKPAKFNKTWWESLSSMQRFHIVGRYKNSFLPVKDKTSLQEISTLLGFKEKTLSAYYGVLDPQNLTDIEPGSVRFYRIAQADRAFKLLEGIGIETPERINDVFYVDKLNKKQLVGLEKIKKDRATLIENKIDTRTKRQILLNFSKASKEYIKGNYGAITSARGKLRALINREMAAMSESELRSYIKNNPVLLAMAENEVGINGEIIRPIKIKDLTYDQLVNRVSFEEDHIKPFEKAKVDPVTKQVLAGVDIHYPANIRLSTKMANSSFKRKATSFMDRTIDNTDSEIIENRKTMKNYLEFTGQGILEGPEWEGKIIGKKGEVSLLQQVKNLGIDTKTFFAKLPYTEQVQAARLVGCSVPRKAEGGRIGFAAGSGMLACMDAKFKENPRGFFTKIGGLASKGLDKLWGAVSPLFLPAVQIGMGRLEAFKDPTDPEGWWGIMLASDAVKRWGLDKVTLSQLKNASWLKRADIIGKLLLKFPGDKILTKAAKIARPLIVATETLSAAKGVKTELDLVKEWATENNVPYDKAKAAYYISGSALKPRWEGHKSFRAYTLPKLIGGVPLATAAWEARNDQELQERGVEIFKYIKENKQEPVEEKVTEEFTKKIELPDMPTRAGYRIKENLQASNQPIGVNRYMQLIK